MAGEGGAITVGAVAVDIVPSAQNFLGKLIKEVGPDVAAVAKTAGASIEKEISSGTSDGVKKGLKDGKKGAAKDGADAGAKFSGGFAAAVKSGMAAVQASLGSISVKAEVDADVSDARAEVMALKREIAAFSNKTIDISLDDRAVLAKVAAIKAALSALSESNTDLGIGSEIRNAYHAVDGLVERMQAANTQTGAFAQKIDDYYKSILKTFTDTDIDLPIDVDTGDVDAATLQVDELRRTVARFRQDNAGGLLDGNAVKAQIASIVSQLGALEKVELNDRLAYEVRAVRKDTDGLVEDLAGVKKVKVEADTKPAKVELEGFAREIARVAESASKAISVRVDLDDDQVYPALAKVKAALRDIVARIGVDLDDSEALDQIRVLRQQLAEVERKRTANIGVSQDFKTVTGIFDKFVGDLDKSTGTLDAYSAKLRNIARTASAQISVRADLDDDEVYSRLAEIKAALNGIVARIGVDMDDAEALARIRVLNAQIKDLTKKKSINIEVDREVENVSSVFDRAQTSISNASKGISSLQEAFNKMTPAALLANAQVVGFTVGLPAIIALAVFALTSLAGILSFVGMAAIGAGLGIGVMALALTKVTAAIQEREQAAKQAAAQAAQDAATEFSNATAVVNANEAIASAEKALTRARTSGQKSVTQSARTLAGAERNLTAAQEKEKDARKKLSQAYVDAKNDLKKLTAEIISNRIEQQKTVASIHQSREAYNALLADPTASQSAIQAAQAEYNTQEANLKKLRAEQSKNETEKARYDAVGLEANAGVISAQAALKSAIESVTDATDAQKTAAENAAQTQIDATNSVNDAEEALAQARTDRANLLKQQALAAAATTASRTASTSTFDELTDGAKSFVEFYEQKIKPVIDDLFKTAQDSGVLSGIVGFLDAVRPLLPSVKELIGTVGHEVGVFLIQIGNFLASDEGKDFIAFLGDMVKKLEPIMASLAKSGLKIMFTLLEALAPVIEEMGPQLAVMAEQFAVMFAEFVKSDEFKALIQMMIDNGPLLLTLILDLLKVLVDVMVALGPVAKILVQILDWVLKFLDFLGPAVIQYLLLGIATIFVALWDTLVGLFQRGWDELTSQTMGFLTGVRDVFVGFWHWFADGWTGIWDDAWNQIVEWGRNIEGFWQGLVDGFGRIWDGIVGFVRAPLRTAIGFVNDYLIAGFNTVSAVVHGPHIDAIAVPGASTGMIVPGYQSSKRDEVPTMLRKGEGVLVPEVVRELGPATILEWNRRANLGQRVRHYATGGIVDGEPGGLAGTLLGRVRDKVTDGAESALGEVGESTFGKLTLGMADTLLTSIGSWLVEKVKALGDAIGDAASDVAGFVKSLFGAEEPSAHEQGSMATPVTAAAYAKSMLGQFGWDSTDMTNLAKLWNGESGWRWNAKNPDSGAYGIPQSLPATKMASVGADWATNAFTQVLWGMGYIKDRYGDPTNAYLTWLGRTPHWYDTGGYLPPGLTLAYNGTGRNERVMTHEQEQEMLRERALRGGADVNVYVHDGKVSGLISAEVDRQFGTLADSFVYGGV